MQIQAGQNTALSATALTLTIACRAPATASGAPLTLDASAYLLADTGRVHSDAGMVFYGQNASADGAVRVDAASHRFEVDLARVPANVARISITLTIEQGTRRGQRFSQVQSVALTCSGGGEQHVFDVDTAPMNETALILAELYRRDGAWKLRAVGQGFVGGLAALARHFGVEISDDPDTAAPPSTPVPAPLPVTALTPPPPPASPAPAPLPSAPASPPVRLNKITLEKRTPVRLEKAGGAFGDIVVNLNWTKQVGKKGLFGLGKSAIDLDLGCMIELTSGAKSVVQALGDTFGNFDAPPYARLLADDRTGASVDGEFVNINGNQWAAIKRVLIYAFIYEGAPSWAEANAAVSIRVPGQPELAALLDSHSDRQGMCAVAMLENEGGQLKATKLVEYFSGHREMDQRYGFGFRWAKGSK